MLPGFTGSLVSEYFAEEFLFEAFGQELAASEACAARAGLLRHYASVRRRLGPVCAARQVHDLVAAPLAAALGFDAPVVRPDRQPSAIVSLLGDPGRPAAALFTIAWGESLDSAWRDAVRAALACSAGWCLCANGPQIRLLDARRSYGRRYAQFDLDAALDDERVFAVLWALLHRRAFGGVDDDVSPLTLLDRIVRASDDNAVGVCRSLRAGVLEAVAGLLASFVLGRGRRRQMDDGRLHDIHQQALTIVYRLLFLLFAESRRLVPDWHPIYRNSYSLEAARSLAERPGPARGLWEMLQAISRLSHAGCQAGPLRVTAFNGRLFSPAATPLGESRCPGDDTARRVLLALSTAPRAGGRARIAYRDLDVEQLGAVYESLLDHVPRATSVGIALQPSGGLRKATASFYTPRPLTTYLVARTLSPLVADAAPEEILAIRVVDPAMGSGAFLVAACRYLSAAYEASLVRSGRCLPSDLDESDRRGFRRAVAARCLYGVDLNPMAVQLARLSLWLATLAPDRPLTFLDHRLLVGDSLVGASPEDAISRLPPGAGRAQGGRVELPLFDTGGPGTDLAAVVPRRTALAEQPDDSAAAVHRKEQVLSALSGSRSPLARWKTVLDLWCAQAFLPPGERIVRGGIFGALADHVLTGRSPLSDALVARHLTGARAALASLRPLHWTLEFPEVFYQADGTARDRPGFDAVLGNPPWDAIPSASRLLRFTRDSGIYRAQGGGHGNLFQLFVERAFQLARPGGRVGLIVPWGLAADHGCAALRRMLFDRATVDSLVGFDNANAIFPIHRSVRFLAFSATSGGATSALPVRLGERDPAALDQLPGDAAAPARPVVVSRHLLERLSGSQYAIPDVRSERDLRLLEKLSGAAPPLGGPDGWQAEFGRELNATDDQEHFTRRPGGLPVLEGKHVEPFRAVPGRVERWIAMGTASRVLGTARFARARLAYRDVASATNRLTLIAARVPAGCVTVHSLFCLNTHLPTAVQFYLCGVMNSFVANYFVRLWVTTHVTTAIVARLPVPRPPADSALFRRIARFAVRLSRSNDAVADPLYPLLQAAVAAAYSLTPAELSHVLATFPLVDASIRRATLARFEESGTRS